MITFESIVSALYPEQAEKFFGQEGSRQPLQLCEMRPYTYKDFENGVAIPERLREELEFDMTVDGIHHDYWTDRIHEYLERELDAFPDRWFVEAK